MSQMFVVVLIVLCLTVTLAAPTKTPTPTNTHTMSLTRTLTGMPTHTTTVTPTGSPTTTLTHIPTRTETPTRSSTRTPTPSDTDTSTQTGTHSPSPTTSTSTTRTQSLSITTTVTTTPTSIPTRTTTRTPTPTPTGTPTSLPSRTPTSTTTPSHTATATHSVSRTATSTRTPSSTPTHTSTMTDVRTITSTHSASSTGTAVPTRTSTSSPTPTPTGTPTTVPTRTPTASPTPTYTGSRTHTGTRTATSSPSPSPTPSRTGTSTPTPTSSRTESSTRTPTQTPTPSQTLTDTPTQTRTSSPTGTPTTLPTRTATDSSTQTEPSPIKIVDLRPAHGKTDVGLADGWLRVTFDQPVEPGQAGTFLHIDAEGVILDVPLDKIIVEANWLQFRMQRLQPTTRYIVTMDERLVRPKGLKGWYSGLTSGWRFATVGAQTESSSPMSVATDSTRDKGELTAERFCNAVRVIAVSLPCDKVTLMSVTSGGVGWQITWRFDAVPVGGAAELAVMMQEGLADGRFGYALMKTFAGNVLVGRDNIYTDPTVTLLREPAAYFDPDEPSAATVVTLHFKPVGDGLVQGGRIHITFPQHVVTSSTVGDYEVHVHIQGSFISPRPVPRRYVGSALELVGSPVHTVIIDTRADPWPEDVPAGLPVVVRFQSGVTMPPTCKDATSFAWGIRLTNNLTAPEVREFATFPGGTCGTVVRKTPIGKPCDEERSFEVVLKTHRLDPLSPVVWAVHNEYTRPIYTEGGTAGPGLKLLAEDGAGSTLLTELAANPNVRSSGIASPNPNRLGPAAGGDDIRFTVTARGGDYLSFATMFVRSNDRFYAPANFLRLFDGCDPLYDQRVPLKMWDAGTERNQGYWANHVWGQMSMQPGGGNTDHTADPDTRIRLVEDWEFSNDPLIGYPNTFPWPSAVVSVWIQRGLLVDLQPPLRGLDGASASVEFAFDRSDIGNEIHLTFPDDFRFNVEGDTRAWVLSGLDPTMPDPNVVVEGATVQLRWGDDIVLERGSVAFNVSHLGFPNHCEANHYTAEARRCRFSDVHGAGRYVYHECDPPLVTTTTKPPGGYPKGCSLCNACIYKFTLSADKYYQCTNDDHTFLRRNLDSSALCVQ